MLIKKLFTREDYYNIHKILGFLSLLNFIYRYCFLLINNDDLGYSENTYINHCSFLVHVLLSSSSLIFKVLSKRSVSKSLIIYEEYRLHAILFTLRSYGIYLFNIYNSLDTVISVLFILFCHLLIDIITEKYGTKGVTAVRNNGKHRTGIKYYGRFFYSYYQILVTGCLLLPFKEKSNLAFNALIAIQSSAFLMTLNRKGLIKWYTHAFWYSLSLFFSYYYIKITVPITVILMSGVVFALRIYNINKYICWALFFGFNNIISIYH